GDKSQKGAAVEAVGDCTAGDADDEVRQQAQANAGAHDERRVRLLEQQPANDHRLADEAEAAQEGSGPEPAEVAITHSIPDKPAAGNRAKCFCRILLYQTTLPSEAQSRWPPARRPDE